MECQERQVCKRSLTFGLVYGKKATHNCEAVWLMIEMKNVNRGENMVMGLFSVDDVMHSINRISIGSHLVIITCKTSDTKRLWSLTQQ